MELVGPLTENWLELRARCGAALNALAHLT
jgi:hypothetical protein